MGKRKKNTGKELPHSLHFASAIIITTRSLCDPSDFTDRLPEYAPTLVGATNSGRTDDWELKCGHSSQRCSSSSSWMNQTSIDQAIDAPLGGEG